MRAHIRLSCSAAALVCLGFFGCGGDDSSSKDAGEKTDGGGGHGGKAAAGGKGGSAVGGAGGAAGSAGGGAGQAAGGGGGEAGGGGGSVGGAAGKNAKDGGTTDGATLDLGGITPPAMLTVSIKDRRATLFELVWTAPLVNGQPPTGYQVRYAKVPITST